MSASSRSKPLLRRLRKAGWTVWHGSKHYRACSPDGQVVITLATSPTNSGYRQDLEKIKSIERRSSF